MKRYKHAGAVAAFILLLPIFASADTMDVRELKKLLELGKRYCEISRFEKAISKYKEAFEKFNSPDAAYNLAITYEIDVNDKEKALYYYGRFLELESNSVDAENVKRWVSEVKHEIKKSKKKRSASLTRRYGKEEESSKPRNEQYTQKNNANQRDSKTNKKVRMLKKLANKEVLKKNYAKGIEIYLQVLEMSSDSDAAYNLGFVYDHYMHNFEEAGYYYRKFLQLEPFSSDAAQVKKWLKRVEEQM